MTLESADICDVVQAVVTTCLGPDATSAPAAPPGDGAAPSEGDVEELVGSVTVQGAWNGVITVSCPPRLARSFARHIFQSTEAETSDADALDALAEITNMVGGNLKSMLSTGDEPCKLSLPRVARVARAAPAAQQYPFSVERDVLQIAVLADEAAS